MTNDLILKRTINVNCWNVEATISTEKERNELMFLLMFLRDNPNSTARELSKESFFDISSRVVVAERLLGIANLYGLVEQEESKGKNIFALTEDGSKALETRQVFVPKEGTWTILASDDSLLPFPILLVEAFNEPNAINEVHSKTNEREFEVLPSWLIKTKGQTGCPCLGKHVLRFDSLQPKAETKADEKLQVEWNISQNTLKLKGHMNGKKINKDIEAPTIDFQNIWQQLLKDEGWWDNWNEDNQKLALEFEDTVPQERQSMKGDFYFEHPRLEQFGRFEKLAVNKISLTPLTSRDAQLWAEWRLENSINDYATKSNFVNWQRTALEPFPDFEVDLPNRQYLAQEFWQENKLNPTTTTWHLIAAEDWNL